MAGAAPDEVTSLAVRAGRGDRVALAGFIRVTQPDVWRFCAHLADRHRAEDLTQETYLRAVGALPRFRGDSSAMTWLLAIARRVVADGWRVEARHRRRLRAAGGPQAVAGARGALAAAGGMGALELRLCLDQLAPDRRTAFVLTQVLGYSYAEAAEVCGCPVGTIRSRVARARQDLLDALGGGADGRSALPAGG